MTTAKSRPAAKKTAAKKTAAKKVVRRAPKTKAELLDHTLEFKAYVPPPTVAEKYVNRKVHGTWDATVAKVALRKAKNIILMGDTGSGKTLFGEAFASKFGMNYYSLPCDVSIDPSALFGRMQPTEEVGRFEWQDGPITEIVREGGVLNISEINFMTPKIAASLYSLLDGRRYLTLLGHHGEVVRAHLGTQGTEKCWCALPSKECNTRRVLIIADMNPQYRGTQELNAAFFNRFDFKVPWGYDPLVEESLVNFPTMREIAGRLRDMANTELVTPVSTNMLMEFEEFSMEEELGVDFAIHNFVAAFQKDEQSAVDKVFDLQKDTLEKDRKFYAAEQRRKARRRPAKETDEDVEEVSFEFMEEDD